MFLHLLSMIALYVSAGSFIALIFSYINLYFPDILTTDNYYYSKSLYESIRWSISILIIVFPVYLWTNWTLGKQYSALPEKRNLKVRKWLIYFTIFIAAGVIIGDVVTLIYNLLGGELTIRFLFKILTVLLVSGAIFGYYFSDLRKYRTE